MDCAPFYRDPEEPIWYGRVIDLTRLNQNLLVYGYITERED
jgi:hypothetical protein